LRTEVESIEKQHVSYVELLKRLGFEADPFAKTNADEEERLNNYFIPPPFFNAVLGTPNTPKSALVFAPRGGGKTALKRKIEIEGADGDFLCVTYNAFDVSNIKLNNVTAAYHLTNIVRLVLVAVITAAAVRGVTELSSEDRHLLYLLTKIHLSKISTTELKGAIGAVQTFPDQAKELWNKFAGPLAIVINALLEKIGLGSAELKKFESQKGDVGSLTEQLRVLSRLSAQLGFPSIYVLIDKIDETPITNGAANAFQFIAPIITDLQLLELQGYAFKCFLWDRLLDDYQKVARPDRVKYYVLQWSDEQLRKMLSERLRAYSAGKISSLQQISQESGLDLDQIVTRFAQGSPRTVIRICKEIVDQQSEIDPSSGRISAAAIIKGFDQIAGNVSAEAYPEGMIRDLQRTKRCDFTIRYLYIDVFRCSQQNAMNKVGAWENAGAVILVGKIQETAGARGSNHYAISHWLLAKHVFSDIPINSFVERKMRQCDCGQWLVRDWDSPTPQTCHHCQREVPR
jgi:hypothetical protein